MVQVWIENYGYFVLFFGLMLELFAIPFPGEILMSYVGFLAYSGKLDVKYAIFFALLGSCLGMTIAYYLGFRLGYPFVKKYGSFVGLNPERFEKASNWFRRFGNKTLIIGYFIPGIRHFTGYFSGIARMSYRVFLLYAYSGALIWTCTFILLGKSLGPHWEKYHSTITHFILVIILIVILSVSAFYLYKNYRKQLIQKLFSILNGLKDIFRSFKRTGLIISIFISSFFLLLVWIIRN